MEEYKVPMVFVDGIMTGQKSEDGRTVTSIELQLPALNEQLKKQEFTEVTLKEE